MIAETTRRIARRISLKLRLGVRDLREGMMIDSVVVDGETSRMSGSYRF